MKVQFNDLNFLIASFAISSCDLTSDGGEVLELKTDPTNADTDGVFDGDEISFGTDPLDYYDN